MPPPLPMPLRLLRRLSSGGALGDGAGGACVDSPRTAALRKRAPSRSPMVQFSVWNSLRFLLQLLGLGALAFVAPHQSFALAPLWALVCFYCFAALPVLLQSSISFAIACVRLLRLRALGRLRERGFRHLLYKEAGRLVLVGIGSTVAIALMPTFLFEYHGLYGRKRLWLALFVAGFCYYNVNNFYNVLANLVTLAIIHCKRRARRLAEEEAEFATAAATESDGDGGEHGVGGGGDDE